MVEKSTPEEALAKKSVIEPDNVNACACPIPGCPVVVQKLHGTLGHGLQRHIEVVHR